MLSDDSSAEVSAEEVSVVFTVLDMTIGKSNDIEIPVELVTMLSTKLDFDELDTLNNIELSNPKTVTNIEKCLDILRDIKRNNQKILSVGDYDCDVICATTILATAFEKCKLNYGFYIPNRLTEGYGLNVDILKKAIEKGYQNIVPPMLGICINNPESTEFEYGIGSLKEYCTKIPKDFKEIKISKHLWGKFYTKGKLPHTIQNLWKEVVEWIQNSQFEIAANYDFECYTEGDTNNDDYVSGIWVPLKLKE